ncbi:hypothetical protein [Marinobacterium arenosum]|uniref:hypothetical protein n=1 Tax=Marinobacterium arenosum TaxID=2862496 RepID=UPI001C93F4AF|nr:hypothetical protein [Marinobacterium arenosum]MBY4678416.1 hypothetical protein [Marinobacterium arenosum]
MSRLKKRRHTREWVEFEENGPSRRERLANPDSYESRKRRALAEKKKNKSVFQKEQEKAESGSKQQGGNHARGPLADKIRKLNADKAQQDQQD